MWGLPRKRQKAPRQRPQRKKQKVTPEQERAAVARWWIKKLNAAIDAARRMKHDD
jgi:hypothetical protein